MSQSKIDYTKLKFNEKEQERIRKEVNILGTKYPNHIPIVVRCDKHLKLTKYKYLVASDISVGQFLIIVRKRLENKVDAQTGLYLFINNVLHTGSSLMYTVYQEHKDTNTGMLFVTLCKENTFGTV